MPRDFQPSFTGGEISPGLYGRVDLARYQTSLALCKNFFVQAQGGATSRAGFRFVYDIPENEAARLVPFEYNTEQTYILAFTNQKMRVIKDGGVVLEPELSITNVTTDGVVTAANTYTSGDEVYITGTGTTLDNRFWIIDGVTASGFSTNHTNAGSTFGKTARVFVLTTPWLTAELPTIAYTQTADLMTLTHPNHPPQELSRLAHYDWAISVINFQSSATPPTNVVGTNVGAPPSGAVSVGKIYRYVVTTVKENGDESVASAVTAVGRGFTMTDGLGVKLEWNSVVGADYYNVYKEQSHKSGTFGFVGEADSVPDTTKPIQQITDAAAAVLTCNGHGLLVGDSFFVSGITSSGNSYSDAVWAKINNKFVRARAINGNDITLGEAEDNSPIATTLASVAPGSWGVINTRPGFTDYNLGPDVGVTPPINNNPFDGAGKYPIAVTYFEQRLSFGGSIDYPQTFWLTKTADYDNMDYSRPRRADDSIEIGLAALQVNEIRHLIPMEDLMILTSGGAWAIKSTDDGGVLTPLSIRAVRQGGRGSSKVRPLEIGGTALFIQDKGARIWNLAYTFNQDKHVTADLSILAEHLFRGYTIDDWTYAEEPYSIAWCIRSDGAMLGLTYMQDQEVWSWHQHQTDGNFKTIASIKEADQDAVYVCVERVINGTTKHFIERQESRMWDKVEDAFCLDAALDLDLGTGTTQTISNLHHLEGETITALGDGNVIPDLVVTDGKVTLPVAVSKIVLGLGYTCDIQTLPVDFTSAGGTSTGRKKAINQLALRVRNTRGLSAGKSFDESDQHEFKERTPSDNYDDIQVKNGMQFLDMMVTWTDDGNICIRQKYPLPATILGIAPEVTS